MNEFGNMARQRRHELGLSLRDVAAQVELDFTYLSKVERAGYPPPSEAAILRLAQVLYLDGDDLLAAAKRVASDILDLILTTPSLRLSLRCAANCSKEREIVEGLRRRMGEGNLRG